MRCGIGGGLRSRNGYEQELRLIIGGSRCKVMNDWMVLLGNIFYRRGVYVSVMGLRLGWEYIRSSLFVGFFLMLFIMYLSKGVFS